MPPGVLCPASLSPLSLLLLLSLRIPRTAGLGAPTAWAALENVSVMEQAIVALLLGNQNQLRFQFKAGEFLRGAHDVVDREFLIVEKRLKENLPSENLYSPREALTRARKRDTRTFRS